MARGNAAFGAYIRPVESTALTAAAITSTATLERRGIE